MPDETTTTLEASEAATLLERVEQLVEKIVEHEVEILVDGEPRIIQTVLHEFADVTQLRLAVHRLELFLEHLVALKEDEPVRQAQLTGLQAEASEEDEFVPAEVKTIAGGENLNDMTRAELDAKADELGVEEPDTLPNKQAVIDAIREAEDDELEDEE